MFSKIFATRAGCACLILSLVACGTGTVPNDVSQGVGFSDYQAYQARREALRAPAVAPAVATQPQTALPPAEVTAEPFATPPAAPAARAWIPVDPAPASTAAAVSTIPDQAAPRDVASIASAAIAEAEGANAPAAPLPMTGGADNFTAPPLPDTMSVVGLQVAAYALNTTHAVGDRVYSRFPLRFRRAEVECRDFRTTDLAQDWFLSNEGPERDRAGLDPDGDGFACNWTPYSYRTQAQAPAPVQPRGVTAASSFSDG